MRAHMRNLATMSRQRDSACCIDNVCRRGLRLTWGGKAQQGNRGGVATVSARDGARDRRRSRPAAPRGFSAADVAAFAPLPWTALQAVGAGRPSRRAPTTRATRGARAQAADPRDDGTGRASCTVRAPCAGVGRAAQRIASAI